MASRESGRRLLPLAMAVGMSGAFPALAVADDALPDLEFLEYLGSWEESDDEWLLFSDEAGDGESDTEQDDSTDDVMAADEDPELNNER